MAHTFAFDEDMDQIWAQCCELVVSHQMATKCASALVKPWHLALLLLFGELPGKEDDSWLYLDEARLSVSKSLEMPLFWAAISRVSAIGKRLDEHLRGSMEVGQDAPYLQQRIGRAFWRRVEQESDDAELAALSGGEEDHVLGYATRSTANILVHARKMAEDYGSNYIAPQHVLLALLQDDALRGDLSQWRALNVEELPDAVRTLRPMRVSAHNRPQLFPTLNDWAVDLTQIILDKKANLEPIDPLIGRTVELRRLVTILSKYKKNSAVLLGDPGVGKTAIAEALAHRIVESKVPESVVARVFSLDLTSILASTQCKLAYEQIITNIMKEVAEHEVRGTRAILFFDNLSQITIGGYQEDGSGLDAASIMKQFFALGMLRCVGCSTVEDFRDHIEKDGALARRFSPVFVCESTPSETTDILRGLKAPLQSFHNARITDAAFKVATSIATQYFSHQRLPDAALDLVDEACASVSLSRFRTSEEVWNLQRRKVAMEIEIRSLERQIDNESEQLLEDMRYKLSRLDEEIQHSTSLKRYRRRLREELRVNDERRAETLKKLQTSIRAAKGQLIDKIADLDVKSEELKRTLTDVDSGELTEIPDGAEGVQSPSPVTAREVAMAASYYTFIPAATGANVDVANLDQALEKVVVGQPKAIEIVSGVMRSLWAGLKNPRRPIASILFGGPSGSGKTLLVKELAKIAARQSGKLITINASDYSSAHAITRLIGTPTCTGFDQGGQLTECVRRKPFSVVYIREIERGCTEFRMFIQTILDEGVARDGDGNLVNFMNCVIILTTALGRTNLPHSRIEAHQHEHFQKEIHRHLPGEFLARIDSIVIFRPVTGDALMVMIDARLEELRGQLAVINFKLAISDRAHDYIPALLVQEGAHTPQRIERWIRNQVIQPLTTLLLTTDAPKNATVALDIDDFDQLSVRLQEGHPSPPHSPASAYYSLADTDAEYSDIESVPSESSFVGSITQRNPISVRPGLRAQPQRMF